MKPTNKGDEPMKPTKARRKLNSNSKYKLVPIGNEEGETYYPAGAFLQRGRQLVGAASAVDNLRAVEMVERANRCAEAEQRAERSEAEVERLKRAMNFGAEMEEVRRRAFRKARLGEVDA